AIEEALKNPGMLDKNKYEAQQARRILDRLVGYLVSPILWTKVKRGLSAGRVQSVALRLICERERQIQQFVPEEYWTMAVELRKKDAESGDETIVADLWQHKNKKIKIKNEKQAKTYKEQLEKATFVVDSVEKKERKRQSAAPFKTSTLQQEAARKLRFTARHTMSIAQRLYEGVALGDEGEVGLITYMRTDSTRLSQEAVNEARKYIGEKWGKQYIPPRPRVFKNRKGIQDAHEAIRPTSVYRTPDQVAPYLDKDQLALYELIWKRFVACQMAPAVFDQTTIKIKAGDFALKVVGSILKFEGFMKVYVEGTDNGAEKNGRKEDVWLPELPQGTELDLIKIESKQHFTQPPPRYSEATLVKELEEKGIGRPSTYATILSTIQEKEYVVRENMRFRPTELGFLINDLLVENFPNIFNVKFTAEMEESLDKVEEGKLNYLAVLKMFYDSFESSLEEAQEKMKDLRREGIPTEIICDQCGNKMNIKWGRNGPFLACSTYPKCQNTCDYIRNDKGMIVALKDEETQEKCEVCGKPLVVKRGRFGTFLACSGYPECKFTKSIDKDSGKTNDKPVKTDQICEKCGGHFLIKKNRYGGAFLACENYPKCKNTRPIPTGIPCPEDGCDGELVERVSRNRRRFYGCSRYPKCKFVIWNKPVKRECPECGYPFLVEKYSKKEGNFLACPNAKCGFKLKEEDQQD
ncbi:MAG TPA: type I DNA topoisomerase, partial [Deltaproteobacteria bacterium]|nr:type I DNA topoisomerase [Deltaproteobacteria bacterium]